MTIEQQNVHLELQMMSSLKSYFKERNIDISDTISRIKETKRNTDSNNIVDKQVQNMYWQLTTLVFTAFYLDHSQNDYLGIFFAQKLQ